MSVEFLITSFIVIVSPGAGVLYTLAAGLSRGSRASVVAAFGCTMGIVPHMSAAIMGLAALLHTSALAFQFFKYLGVAYLLYMAWNTLCERGALGGEGGRCPFGGPGDRDRDIDQHPQSEAVDLLSGVPAAIRERGRVESAFAHARLERRLHADDLRDLRRLRAVRSFDSRPRDLASAILTWMRRTFAGAFAALGAKLALADR